MSTGGEAGGIGGGGGGDGGGGSAAGSETPGIVVETRARSRTKGTTLSCTPCCWYR